MLHGDKKVSENNFFNITFLARTMFPQLTEIYHCAENYQPSMTDVIITENW